MAVTDTVLCGAYYDEMYPKSQCLLPADHDPEAGHLSDTGRGGQRLRWWPVQSEDD